mmetsp:Transcript_132949/g.384382  ORF Transcript_132949/g.384382 Transcript_132949/m.384382 type:complete len:168 (-) Transcript_132949:97-600(-)
MPPMTPRAADVAMRAEVADRAAPAASATSPPGLAEPGELRQPPGLVSARRRSKEGVRSSPAARRTKPKSTGLQSHALGTCRPCLYLLSGLCHKGTHCSFCHLQHDERQLGKVRPSKRTRACLVSRRQRLLHTTMDEAGAMAFDEELHRTLSAFPALPCIIVGYPVAL